MARALCKSVEHVSRRALTRCLTQGSLCFMERALCASERHLAWQGREEADTAGGGNDAIHRLGALSHVRADVAGHDPPAGVSAVGD